MKRLKWIPLLLLWSCSESITKFAEIETESQAGEVSNASSSSASSSSLEAISSAIETKPANMLPIMSWVPYYANKDALTTLNTKFGDHYGYEVVNRIGLQFWNVKKNSTLDLLVDSAKVVDWVRYREGKDMEILLTVINNGEKESDYKGFDWKLLRVALSEGPDALVKSLVDEVKKYDLDGVDLDFEGEVAHGGPFTQADREQYSAFVKALSKELKKDNKLLTVDSYFKPGLGAPNADWWSDWQADVDAIHSMGYQHLFKNAPGEKSYKGQQALAISLDVPPEKLFAGFPMWLHRWAGSVGNKGIPALENLKQIQNCLEYPASISIWDIHHPTSHKTWRSAEIWETMLNIRKGIKDPDYECEATEADLATIDDMLASGFNKNGGMWFASSDYYSRRGNYETDEEDRESSSKVWNRKKNYDQALQEGTWGDIGRGYRTEDGKNYLSGTIEIVEAVVPGDTNSWAYAGFVMEFEERDCSKSKFCWEVNKTGVARDLSPYDSLWVSLRCDAGKSVGVGLTTIKDNLLRFGKMHECAGEWENVHLDLKNLTPIREEEEGVFDAIRTFSLHVYYANFGVAEEVTIDIRHVSLDEAYAP
jgi:hypothetical protein